MNPTTARRALAGIRLVNGTLGLFAPRLLLRRLGTDADVNPSGIYPFRMFGIRTILLGADLLLLEGQDQLRAARLAVLIHGSDTISAATAGLHGTLPRRVAVMTSAISGLNTALAFAATRER